MSRSFTVEQVAAEAKSSGKCLLIISSKVYDVSKFLDDHPGGAKVLLRESGKDATSKFNMFHSPSVLEKFGPALQVGVIGSGKSTQLERKSSQSSQSAVASDSRYYGELVSYGDPNWYQGYNSPYYTESHHKWRAHCRAFCEKELMPYVNEWDEAGAIPDELYIKAGKAGILASTVGHPYPAKYLKGTGLTAPKDFNSFHELILLDELSRCGSGGVLWGLYEGLSIGLPPILQNGPEHLREKVTRECLLGTKKICLAITEPWTGSDVAGIRTTARREGDYFIVNGAKKWITNGIFADYFTVAVRTGGPGHGGLSMLLMEKGMPGLKCRKMKCMGVWPSGTTYITFEDVKVPVSNIIGKEGRGFAQIMFNFNHERWALIAQAARFARVCLEESIRYAMKRKTFGKPLIKHQAIRMKIAHMARQVEANHAWLEQITYQLDTMSHAESNRVLAGPIALLKANTTRVFEFCAREAAQIFGGASYVRGGQGEKVERLYREVRAYAIPGGSEEIMLDFGARQAAKNMKKLHRSKL